MNVESSMKPLQHENMRTLFNTMHSGIIKMRFPYFVEQQNEVQGEGQEQRQEAEVVEVPGEVILHRNQNTQKQMTGTRVEKLYSLL